MATMDPYEGSYSHVNASLDDLTWDALSPDLKATRGLTIHDFQFMQSARKIARNAMAYTDTEIFMNCWHLSSDGSDAMWKIYASSDNGICIQSDIHSLIDALAEAEDNVYLGEVIYRDYRSHFIPKYILALPA
jgi:hypothetical protein